MPALGLNHTQNLNIHFIKLCRRISRNIYWAINMKTAENKKRQKKWWFFSPKRKRKVGKGRTKREKRETVTIWTAAFFSNKESNGLVWGQTAYNSFHYHAIWCLHRILSLDTEAEGDSERPWKACWYFVWLSPLVLTLMCGSALYRTRQRAKKQKPTKQTKPEKCPEYSSIPSTQKASS